MPVLLSPSVCGALCGGPRELIHHALAHWSQSGCSSSNITPAFKVGRRGKARAKGVHLLSRPSCGKAFPKAPTCNFSLRLIGVNLGHVA